MRMEAAAGPEPASLTAMLTALPIKLRCHTSGWYSDRHPRSLFNSSLTVEAHLIIGVGLRLICKISTMLRFFDRLGGFRSVFLLLFLRQFAVLQYRFQPHWLAKSPFIHRIFTFMHNYLYILGNFYASMYFYAAFFSVLEKFLMGGLDRVPLFYWGAVSGQVTAHTQHSTTHPLGLGFPNFSPTFLERRRFASLFSFSFLPCMYGMGEEGNTSHKHHYGNSCPDRFIGWNRCNYWDRSFRLSFASDKVATLFNTNVLLCVVWPVGFSCQSK